MVKKNNATFNKNNRQKVWELKNRIIGRKKNNLSRPNAWPVESFVMYSFSSIYTCCTIYIIMSCVPLSVWGYKLAGTVASAHYNYHVYVNRTQAKK